jgi:uncharacterized membrane protein YfcA
MENLPLLLVIGLVAGVMSGMFGIGGGAIIVPALIIFMGFEQTLANGTSLVALLMPVGIFACIAYYRQGKLRIKPAAATALGLAIGAWFGATVALDLDPTTLRMLYGLFLVFMAWRYTAPRKWWLEVRGIAVEQVQEHTDAQEAESARALIICAVIGLVAGVASGMFGIGGGAIIVPALMLFLRFDQKLATGTSLGALLLPVGLFGVLEYYQAGKVSLETAVPLALLLLLTAFFGARLALSLPTKTVKRLYGLFLLFIGIRFVLGL